jgi:hypothetical protein
MARGSRLRSLEDRMSGLRYLSSARAGGVFGLTVTLISVLDRWLPALQPSPSISVRWVFISLVVNISGWILLALAGTGLLRAWIRWRVVRLRRRAI